MADIPHSPDFDGDADAREANRLYWDTDESVNGITERLELSKGRFYDLLTPLPVGRGCPECGAPLGFENRTARDAGKVSCPLCSFEAELDELDDAASGPAPDPASLVHPAARTADPGPHGDAALLGAALVGMAVGVALGRWLRS